MAYPDLPRLATRVKQRRHELRLARLAAAKAAGVSKDTWQRVEEGHLPVREMNYAKIEPILGWAPGSCLKVLAGGEPELIEEQSAESEATAPSAHTPPGVDPVVRKVIEQQMPDGKILAMEYEYDPATGGRTYRFAVAPPDATPDQEQKIKESFRAGQATPGRTDNGVEPGTEDQP